MADAESIVLPIPTSLEGVLKRPILKPTLIPNWAARVLPNGLANPKVFKDHIRNFMGDIEVRAIDNEGNAFSLPYNALLDGCDGRRLALLDQCIPKGNPLLQFLDSMPMFEDDIHKELKEVICFGDAETKMGILYTDKSFFTASHVDHMCTMGWMLLLEGRKTFYFWDGNDQKVMVAWESCLNEGRKILPRAQYHFVVEAGSLVYIPPGSLPVLFLPLSHKDLGKKHSDILASFLHPLICDLETSFSEGFDVDYSYPTNAIHTNIQGGLVRLRTMLMLCTGDHPAQCKLGQLKDGGKSFCRRDKAHIALVEEAHGGRYVYDRNSYQGRYPPKKRKVQDMWDAIRASKRCATKERKEDVLRNAGLSGVSILWQLYHLYGFDISRDLVYDIMHILSLNLFQKYIRKLMFTASTSMKRKIDQIVKDVAKSIPKTILNSGRWPYNPSKHYKMFKAEECQKFVQWCLPQLLNIKEGVSKPDLHLGLLLIDIAHFFFDCSRKKGWTQHDICVCRALLLSWCILSEEHNGPNSFPLEHVAGIIIFYNLILKFAYYLLNRRAYTYMEMHQSHLFVVFVTGCGEIFEDIMRHGSHDCYWCFSFERSISGYLGIPTNNKSNEVSYTHFHSRLLFTRLWQQLNSEKDGEGACGRELKSLHSHLVLPEGHHSDLQHTSRCYDWHKRGVFHVISEKQAREVAARCHRLFPCGCSDLLHKKGVLVGSKRRHSFILNDSKRENLLELYNGSQQAAAAAEEELAEAEIFSSSMTSGAAGGPRARLAYDEENKIEDEGDMSQVTQQVLPTIDEETPFHKGDAMSTQEVVEHESDFVAQKPSNDMNKGSENMLPTIGDTQIHEGNTRNSEEKMVVVENQSDVQTSPKPSDDMIIKDTYSMPLRDEEVEGSEKKNESNEEHQGALATMEVQDKVDKGTREATRNAN
ncbi:hypothetical protein L7F22_056941 [Adiantum nelumboides]|nr:hypothetical protein [Adiantum nelumboides]